MPRKRSSKEWFWTYAGYVKEFREALKTIDKTKAEVFEPIMQQTINKANKIRRTPNLTTD